MMSTSFVRSHSHLFGNTDPYYEEYGPTSTYSSSFFSDYIHYLTKSTRIPTFIHNLLFYFLLFQLFAVSYVPKIVNLWEFNSYITHFFDIVLYVALIKPAPYNSKSFTPIFVTIIVVILLEIVISLVVRFYFDKHRHASKFWCYCSRYFSLFTSTIFFPLSTSFCAEYLNATFTDADKKVSEAMALLVLVIQLITLVRSACFLTLVHHTVPYSEMIFKIHRPFAVTRIYLSLSLCVFIENCLTIENINFKVIHIIIFVVIFINFLWDIIVSDWANETELKLLTSTTFASAVTSLIFLIDDVVKNSTFHKCSIWVTLGADFFIMLIVPHFVNANSKSACKRLSDPEYATKVKTASQAVRDHYIGFRRGHKEVLNCTHIDKLLDRFPNDLNLYLLCARLNLVLKTVPISLENIAVHFQINNNFSPLRTHLYLSLFRLSKPILDEEIIKYKQDTEKLIYLFSRLFESAQTVYDAIIDEIPVILPRILLSYDIYHRRTLQHLFFFVQTYPSSPDTKSFIDLYEILFPKSPIVKELRGWLENSADYVKNNLALFPDLLYAIIENPEIFRSFTSTIVMNNVNLPEIPIDLNKPCSKHRVNSGPYYYKMTRWYILIILFFTFLFPLITTPLLFQQNNRYLHQVNLINRGYSLIWQLARAEAFMYPLYFYENASSPLWSSEDQYNEYKESMVQKLQELQLSLSEFSYSIGGDNYGEYDKKLLTDVMEFMNDNNLPSYFYDGKSSLYQELLGLTYVALDFVACNQIYLQVPKSELSISNATKLFSLLRRMIDDDIGKLENYLSSLNIDISVFLSDRAYLITSLVAICVSFILVVWSYSSASSNFDLFFMTLRDTSKLIIQQMKQYLRHCIDETKSFHHSKKRKIKKTYQDDDDDEIKKKRYSSIYTILLFHIPLIIGFCLLIVFVILEYLLYNCYNDQCLRLKYLYSDYSFSFSSFSISVTESILMKFIDNYSDIQNEELKRSVSDIYSQYQNRSWENYYDGTDFCPLCTAREIYLIYIPYGITYEKVIYNFIVEMSLANSMNNSSPYYDERFLSAIQLYFFSVDRTFVGFANKFTDLCADYYNDTQIKQIAVYVLYILLIIAITIFLIIEVMLADKPFYHVVRLITRFPDSCLAPDTLKILKEKNWQFEAKSFTFDSALYDVILDSLPDAIIVVDQAHTVLLFNKSANAIINTEDAIGKNIFSLMKIKLTCKENNNVISFDDLIINYVFSNRENAVNYELKGKIENASDNENDNETLSSEKDKNKVYYSFTILPLFNEERKNMSIQSMSHQFALIFRDIREEKKSQKFISDETENHKNIIYQILPSPIANRLINGEKSISMTVKTVAISFCDIVSFTPWCGSQTAESVVATLNLMFNLFDKKINQYKTMTKIKCIGDCYMSSAGIFSEGVPPSVFGTEMVCFGLDLVSSINELNSIRGTSLKVRVGAALGGPISAGSMGIEKPFFDIWGDAVNEANKLESTGVPMMVHINQPLYDVVSKEQFEINPKGDGTYLVVRKKDIDAHDEMSTKSYRNSSNASHSNSIKGSHTSSNLPHIKSHPKILSHPHHLRTSNNSGLPSPTPSRATTNSSKNNISRHKTNSNLHARISTDPNTPSIIASSAKSKYSKKKKLDDSDDIVDIDEVSEVE